VGLYSILGEKEKERKSWASRAPTFFPIARKKGRIRPGLGLSAAARGEKERGKLENDFEFFLLEEKRGGGKRPLAFSFVGREKKDRRGLPLTVYPSPTSIRSSKGGRGG